MSAKLKTPQREEETTVLSKETIVKEGFAPSARAERRACRDKIRRAQFWDGGSLSADEESLTWAEQVVKRSRLEAGGSSGSKVRGRNTELEDASDLISSWKHAAKLSLEAVEISCKAYLAHKEAMDALSRHAPLGVDACARELKLLEEISQIRCECLMLMGELEEAQKERDHTLSRSAKHIEELSKKLQAVMKENNALRQEVKTLEAKLVG